MDIATLNMQDNLLRAIHMVNEKGLSISESAKSCHISQLRLYKAVRAHNATQAQQLAQLQLKRSHLFEQLTEIDARITQLERKVAK
ncbi:hypothetical protein N480_23940 [Pseudoalteromonas luteoviolacea S2607]|uniref:hypothetical protein n=1 Tax=Pseudoalteromonas luteoviolacea TaxID=43657 RepID=UPI0007B03DD4|nr:hypothetical protein [Pseudoalteromonas luteoviolacea]KZN33577.1 hypothetical protein N480_23940 [Pseudoalteromonas luteoviolacea S2607]